jgi:L-histidine N-alpha-methyltransferase
MSTARHRGHLAERFSCHIVRPTWQVSGLSQDARVGLLADQKFIPPKYFYDERGSQLFDLICETPEYYPTRTEDALLRAYASDIIARVRPGELLELGSGASRKTCHLLNACEANDCYCTYAPFDVCQEMLVEASAYVLADYQWLNINALVGDYTAGLSHLPQGPRPRLLVFLGGTIGNFTPEQAVSFLSELRALMEPEDRLLLGADRVKDPRVLHAAYNDADGVTAEFNLNLLRVLNRGLDADFELQAFHHQAHYNEGLQRIEMYLIANAPQQVTMSRLEETIRLEKGERILTEISRKFTPESLAGLLAESDLYVEQSYAPANQYYSLILAAPHR